MIGEIQQRIARQIANWRVERARRLVKMHVAWHDDTGLYLAVKEAKRLLRKAGWSDQEITLTIFGKWIDGCEASCSPSVALQDSIRD